MLELYTWTTNNGRKPIVCLEEMGLDYEIHWLDIWKGETREPGYAKLHPVGMIPALVDSDGPGGESVTVWESIVILMYLAEKTGTFMPSKITARYRVIQWLMFQMGHIGPMLGQAHHFRAYAPEPIPYAVDRYTNEARRLYQVLDNRLDGREFVAGGTYSIADMAIFPWCRLHRRQGQDLNDFPNIMRWFKTITARPAVAKDMAKLEDKADQKVWNKESWSNLFGAEQYRRR